MHSDKNLSAAAIIVVQLEFLFWMLLIQENWFAEPGEWVIFSFGPRLQSTTAELGASIMSLILSNYVLTANTADGTQQIDQPRNFSILSRTCNKQEARYFCLSPNKNRGMTPEIPSGSLE